MRRSIFASWFPARKTQRSRRACGALEHLEPRWTLSGASSAIIGEAAVISVSQPDRSVWHEVQLRNSYADPVVILGPLSDHDPQPATVHVRNVAADRFEFQIAEWSYLDGAHGEETISYLVVEAGEHQLIDGTVIVAGATTSDSSGARVPWSTQFGDPERILFTQVMTAAALQPVTSRITQIDFSGFDVRLQTEEASAGHGIETVGWVAVDQASGLSGPIYAGVSLPTFTDATSKLLGFFEGNEADLPLFAGMQSFNGSDPATVRYQIEQQHDLLLRIGEEQSADSETVHAGESLGLMTVAVGDLQAARPSVVLETITDVRYLHFDADPAAGGNASTVGVLDLQTDPGGHRLALLADGRVGRIVDGQWEHLARHVTRFAVRQDGLLHFLKTDHGLYRGAEHRSWSNVADFALSDDGTLVVLSDSGNLSYLRMNGSEWVDVATDVASIELASSSGWLTYDDAFDVERELSLAGIPPHLQRTASVVEVDGQQRLQVFGSDFFDNIFIGQEANGLIRVFFGDRSGPIQTIELDGTDVASVYVQAGEGDDSISLSGGNFLPIAPPISLRSEVFGGIGDDDITGGLGRDVIDAGPGDDVVDGEAGHDEIHGGPGSDELRGGSGSDQIYGGNADDELWGGAGDDFLHGGEGADTLRGDSGNDFLTGGSGRDSLFGGDGDDAIDGYVDNTPSSDEIVDPGAEPGDSVIESIDALIEERANGIIDPNLTTAQEETLDFLSGGVGLIQTAAAAGTQSGTGTVLAWGGGWYVLTARHVLTSNGEVNGPVVAPANIKFRVPYDSMYKLPGVPLKPDVEIEGELFVTYSATWVGVHPTQDLALLRLNARPPVRQAYFPSGQPYFFPHDPGTITPWYENLGPAEASGDMLLVGYGNTGSVEDGEEPGTALVKRMGVTEIEQVYNLEHLGPSLIYRFDAGESAHANGDSGGPGLKFDSATNRPIILGVIQGSMGYSEGALKWLTQITPAVESWVGESIFRHQFRPTGSLNPRGIAAPTSGGQLFTGPSTEAPTPLPLVFELDATLNVHGAGSGETIEVDATESAVEIVIGGVSRSFDRTTVSAIAFNGAAGDDVFRFSTPLVAAIEGGEGFDVVQLTASDAELDLNAFAADQIVNVERFDLRGHGANRLIVNAERIQEMVAERSFVEILADADDEVQFDAGWELAGTTIRDGQFFRIIEQAGVRIEIATPADWQNPLWALDVDGDGEVAPIDALLGINELNLRLIADPGSNGQLPDPTSLPSFPMTFLDVNGDQFITPLDVLIVINYLNRPEPGGEGEQNELSNPVNAAAAALPESSTAILLPSTASLGAAASTRHFGGTEPEMNQHREWFMYWQSRQRDPFFAADRSEERKPWFEEL